MTVDGSESKHAWRVLRPEFARDLTDARLQLHHAAQIVAAMGISYLPKQSDDSHTNLGWLDSVSALASHPVRGSSSIQLAVRPHPFALLLLDNGESSASFTLDGQTVADAAAWVRDNISKRGLDGSSFTLAKHYTIPPHSVGESAPFNARDTRRSTSHGLVFRLCSSARDSSSPIHQTPRRCAVGHIISTSRRSFEVAPGKTVGIEWSRATCTTPSRIST
jgi:hypothetical protein